MAPQEKDWTIPHAMAIPKEGYFKREQGRYGPVFPRTPACYSFTIIAKVRARRERVLLSAWAACLAMAGGTQDVRAEIYLSGAAASSALSAGLCA
jgi:hypothetical protein